MSCAALHGAGRRLTVMTIPLGAKARRLAVGASGVPHIAALSVEGPRVPGGEGAGDRVPLREVVLRR
jgi:hypothetical protein